MAILTLADMEQEVWDNAGDWDPLNRALEQSSPGLTDRVINRCTALVRGYEDDRPYLVTPATSGASTGPGLPFAALTETTYKRILRVYRTNAAGSTLPAGPPLEPWSQWELFTLQQEDPGMLTNDGAGNALTWATAYSVWRAATATAASVGKWNIGFWRTAELVGAPTRYYVLEVLKELALLAAAGDKFDGTEQEGRWVCDMASVIAAGWLGQSEEWIARINARLPQDLQNSAALINRELGIQGALAGAEPV